MRGCAGEVNLNKFKDYMKKTGVGMLALILAVALLSGLAISRSEGEATTLKDASMSLSLPAKQASHGIVGWLEGIYSYMFKYDKLVEENESLKVELAETRRALREAEAANAENERFRELLNLRSKFSSFVFESAFIIDRGNTNWSRIITINKGEESGIEVGDCVIDSCYNLVGQVVELGTGWADVRSIVDADIRVGVQVGEGGNAAMVEGDFALMQKDRVKLSRFTDETQVLEQDILLTSGKGGLFPSGLTVGVVESVHTEAGGQLEYAVVAPGCELGALTEVFVIKDFSIVE